MSEAALPATQLTFDTAPRLRVLPDPEPERPASAPVRPPRSLTPPTPRLEIPPYDLSAALALERELGISHVLAQILVRRGLANAASARAFLEPTERHDPSAFAGIDRALDLIASHVRTGSRITVHGDYDVDGVCATAITVRALRSIGANVGWFIPSRLDDGYGLSDATVGRLAERGTGLLITVDCGITAVDEVAAARAAGLDVIITDHHAPRQDGVLPDCPIIHPAVCGYPFAELCGTAVAFKLAEALEADTTEEDLDLVALATIADLVPLQGENRRLVRAGLGALANTGKPGLRALMGVSQADPSGLDAHVLAFRLAPRINAAGRVRRADAGLELLLTEDQDRAWEIARELDALNHERRAVEQRILWEAEAQVADAGERSAYVLAGQDWHPGVIGIVASRVVERTHRPTIMIALDGELGTGSGRSIPGFDLLGSLHATAQHMERYGGHRAAAGLTIRSERIEAFRAAIEAHAEERLTPELRRPVERIDAIASGSQLGLALADELARLEPCGMGNPGPRLLVPGARFGDLRPMGEDGRHARFSVSSGGALARAVAFGCEGRLAGETPLDATFRLERNSWNGALEARLVLRHSQPCAPEPIEVLGEPEDYLAAVWAEMEYMAPPADPSPTGDPAPPSNRTVLDRRGESPLAVLSDAQAAGGPVLAVCADVDRRLGGLQSRAGAFALIAHHALARDASAADGYAQIVVLDPPSCPAEDARVRAGCGVTHLAWGEPELRFAEQMHELEYGLRASLVPLYRALALRQRVAGEELEHLLRGDGPQARPARLAGRLIKILVELELVSLNRALPALAIASQAQTALESSAAFRVYRQRYEDGRRFLSSPNLRPSA
jgi:single-stranded-DNA-specific exonuclease